MRELKKSINQYRNLGGKLYICWTANLAIFDEEIAKAKKNNLSYRIIKDQLYIEKINIVNPI